jgi:DNA-binding transcriptional MerR regulator
MQFTARRKMRAMNPPEFQTLSAKGYAKICQSELETFETNQDGYRDVCLCLAGSEERVREFLSPKGVGISRFAAMAGLPASTVRHYLRLGLIEPFVVNGKFKFQMVNLMQAESVRQWVDLGVSLEQIRQRKAEQKKGRLLVQDILENVADPAGTRDSRVVVMRRTLEGRGWRDETSISSGAYEPNPSDPNHALTQNAVQHLHAEYGRVTATLEEKISEWQDRLKRARKFLEQLEAAV